MKPTAIDTDTAGLTPLKRAFLALEQAQSKLAALQQAEREPIAVIGLGCRVPGGGDDSASFWRLMHDGVDAIGPVPAERWDAEALYDADPATPGRIATRAGGFLGRIDGFDPEFFSIAPREAQGMDPQQRLLLEVSWEALEHAGQAPDKLERTATGVYVGLCASDYAYMQLQSADPGLLDAHFTSGIAHSIVSGRISYLLGLQGPSLTLDTACSSSLVAVHLACQALRSGDCRMALAGGVNLILSPDLYIALSHSRMLAPDGRCKTFDAAADGFARGEGCGVVVLKKLRDAQADGDRILAVIRGSAVNQDGPSSGLTAPNGPAQEAVIREALRRAGVTPREVGFLEAHGTGTQLGDPLEVHAIGAVFAADRDPQQPLLLGSVKTNIGHLEAAAGITGLIKVVLSLQQRMIPAHLHFRTPSPHIAWGDLPLRVPTQRVPWQPIDGRRIGGVSSFGFSGTNAHVILEEAPAMPDSRPIAGSSALKPCHLLAISARDETSLRAVAQRYRDAFAAAADQDLEDICFTATVGRAHFAERATLLVHSMDELRAQLNALATGATEEGLRRARVTRRDPPRIAFLYTGQGAQYVGMARGLYQSSAIFRASLDRCAALLAPHMARPVLEVLFADDTDAALNETVYTQPALFCVEYALTELLRSWGVIPNAVMGHSVGEWVAACVAGVMSLEDALRLIAQRGRLMQSLPPGGGMAAIFAPEMQVASAIVPYTHQVAVAAVNGPDQTVISGAAAAVSAVVQAFTAQGVRCQPLTVSHAFHSPLVDPILDTFEQAATGVKFSPPRVRLVSNLTGQLAEAEQVTQPRYWRRHVREAVRFGEGLKTLAALRTDCAIEVGPHPTLLAFAKAAFGDAAPVLIPTLRKARADGEQMLELLSALYLAGGDIDWRGVDGRAQPRIVDLPSYPFQRERYWFKAHAKLAAAPRGRDTAHPLLGIRLRGAGSEAVYESCVSADSPGFVRQHRVQDHIIMPATAYLETLLVAARDLFGGEQVCVEDVAVNEAMILADDGAARTVQLVCGPVNEGVTSVSLSSLAESAGDADAWSGHVTANLRRGLLPAATGITFAQAQSACTTPVVMSEFYAGFARRGLDFGAGFHSVTQVAAGELQALGEVALAAELGRDASLYALHPVLLDGCLQVLSAALSAESDDESLYLPIGVARYTLYRRPGTRCWSHVTVQPGGGAARRANLRIFDAQGQIAAELLDVQLKRVSRDALTRLGERWLDDCLYETRWETVPVAPVANIALQSLEAAGMSALPALCESAGLAAYDAFLPKLESLCADYVLRALRELGWNPAAGDTVIETVLADGLGVIARHRRLFGRLLAILGEAGWLRREVTTWTVMKPLPNPDPQYDLIRLTAAYPDTAAELELTSRVASELAAALRGERDPMQLLFPGGSLQTAEKIYRDSPTAKLFNGLIGEVMSALLTGYALDAARPLRILEIGAGTGGTTAHVLPRLPTQGVEYTFTDIGPLFVARAKERFGAHPAMRFEVLNLEHDLQTQGFEAHSFDVILASNVIHATANLRNTLERVRNLLVPDGLLVMLEVTAPQRWFDLTVGLTEGWWAFEDTELRADYATLPRERWLTLLSECGFTTFSALPAGGRHTGALGLQSLLLARSTASRTAPPRDWVIFADGKGWSDALAARLRARGERCTLVYAGRQFTDEPDRLHINAAAGEDYRRLFSELLAGGRRIHGVLHAWSLDVASWDELSAAGLAEAQVLSALSGVSLAQALLGTHTQSPPHLWFITRGAQQTDAADGLLNPVQAPLWGIARTLRLEHPELPCVCLDLDAADSPAGLDAVLAQLDDRGAETQIAVRAGQRRVPRLGHVRRVSSAAARDLAAYRLAAEPRGSLEQLALQPLTRRAPGTDEVEIAVEATGLNFKDVLNVLGMYPGDPGPLGGECAGHVSAVGANVTHVRVGDAVMAVAGGCFASHVIARAQFVQARPAGVSAEEGASIPIAFLTAEFCLSHLAAMRAGDRVLIHAAAGGVGMAAVRLAQRAGAEVFATAGSAWKRELLRSMGVTQVMDSRNAAFADEIMASTGGRGVDIVLNSLAGDLIEPSFRVLARGGRFVEIGKRGIKTEDWVRALNRDLRYFIVDWGDTGERDPALIGDLFARITAAIGSGAIAPLPRHVFALRDAQGAFRFMAQARHAGKIVVRHSEASPVRMRRDGSYLVTGGLSGLGLLVARWLAEQGAGRLVLIGRRGITAESASVIEALRAHGVTVITEAMDVADEAALRGLLARIRAEGAPLRGVVHSAGALDDAGFLQQTAAHVATVHHPKVQGGWLLDALTRSDPLDFFVLFSSVAALLGSRGQANHSAANAFLDLLARERDSRGLPGLSINWGAWTEVGAAADRRIAERLSAQGIGSLTPSQGLLALERLLGPVRPQTQAQVAVLPIDWRGYLAHVGGGAQPPFFNEVAGAAPRAAVAATLEPAKIAVIDLKQQLAAAPPGRWKPMVAGFVRDRALRALGLDAARHVDPRLPLGELGLDSLLAVELRNTLGKALNQALPATLLFDYPSIEALTDYLLEEVLQMDGSSAASAHSGPAAPFAPASTLVDSIEELSDEEVERQLAARTRKAGTT